MSSPALVGSVFEPLVFKEGSFGFTITFFLLEADGTTPVNLAGYAARWRIFNQSTLIKDIGLNIVDASNGVVNYTLQSGDLPPAGFYTFTIRIQSANSLIDSPSYVLIIKKEFEM